MRVFLVASALLVVGMALNPAFSTTKPTYQEVNNTLSPPSKVWGSLGVGQLQTNAWYENIVLGSGYGIVNALPYIVKRDYLSGGLGICAPSKVLNYTRLVKTPYEEDWTLSANEG